MQLYSNTTIEELKDHCAKTKGCYLCDISNKCTAGVHLLDPAIKLDTNANRVIVDVDKLTHDKIKELRVILNIAEANLHKEKT